MSSAAPVAKRILLIDDDRMQHTLLKGFIANFRSGPWEFEAVDSYAAGLKKLLSTRYSVCLLDVQLGDQSGLELLRAARAGDSLTPIILLTGELGDDFEDEAVEAGAMDYLVKGELTPRVLEHSIRYARKLGETLGQLKQMATRDGLTGLLNRREFDRILEEEWQRSTRC